MSFKKTFYHEVIILYTFLNFKWLSTKKYYLFHFNILFIKAYWILNMLNWVEQLV